MSIVYLFVFKRLLLLLQLACFETEKQFPIPARRIIDSIIRSHHKTRLQRGGLSWVRRRQLTAPKLRYVKSWRRKQPHVDVHWQTASNFVDRKQQRQRQIVAQTSLLCRADNKRCRREPTAALLRDVTSPNNLGNARCSSCSLISSFATSQSTCST